MAIPWLIDVLRGAGLQVVEQGDWRNRTRPGSFDPIGVLWHHTASVPSSPSNPHPALSTVINGRPDLAGPLCHALVDYNGVFHLISAGRANHAGATRQSGPIPASSSGNAMLIGWEIDYDGQTQSMSPAQYSGSVVATAAVLKRLGRNETYARGHRETSTTGKIDPSFVNLDQMRADVKAALNPPPLDLGTDDMKLIQATNRGIALVGPGYFRQLRTDEEVSAAVRLSGNPLIGNDRQFDLWKSIAYDGQVKPPAS